MKARPSQEGKLHNIVNLENRRPRMIEPLSEHKTELRGSPEDWLKTGWILEIPRGFLIGGGVLSPLTFDELERASCAVWAPGFFPDTTESSDGSTMPMESKWSEKIGRDDLLAWLSSNLGPAMSKISWRIPEKEKFECAFDRITRAFREEGVKKAVPAVFATGVGATDDRLGWILSRIRAGLDATSKNDLRLYGMWSEHGGFVGATPEALFTRELDRVTSMAVAGTRSIAMLGDRKKDPAAINALGKEFLNDPKERHEHEIVVQDIATVLETAGATVEKSATAVERFGALFHLVTHVEANFPTQMKIRELVTALHPTPALGVSPRDPDLKLLREVHEICGGGVEREGWGAPFVVKNEERVEAVVAIRQLRWTFTENDKIRVVVGSGCGVVESSNVDREWDELEAKRKAVMRLFRLTTEKPEPVHWSLSILERLIVAGVRRFVVCAGARNAPLVVAVEALRQAAAATPDVEEMISVESFFEERAASFYALGLARSSRAPVAILTTSGTAALELQSAIAEADFSGVPLIAVTADRPRRLRLSGAPQSIPQNEVFGSFTERGWDLEEGDMPEGFANLSGLRPLHVNVCLEEPLLIDTEQAPESLLAKAHEVLTRRRALPSPPPKPSADHTMSYAALGSILHDRTGMIAIVGSLRRDDRDAVADFLNGNGIPCLLESTSGLRGDVKLRDLELRGGDRDLQAWCQSGELSSVIRLGGVPTTRAWRNLDDPMVATQTLSISPLRFSGMSRGQFISLPAPGEFAAFLRATTKSIDGESTDIEKEWLAEDRTSRDKLEAVLLKVPNSEPAFVRAISNLVLHDDLVYVGNSLPIRWWDLAATRDRVAHVFANRGVNGIDGQLSTALGLTAGTVATSSNSAYHDFATSDVWILLGDLTALYDLAAPWALRTSALQSFAKAGRKLRIVVLNNSGGRIFTRVLAKAPGGAKPFENEHELEFGKWSEMWGLNYARVQSVAELTKASEATGPFSVIEVVPSSEETAAFWSQL